VTINLARTRGRRAARHAAQQFWLLEYASWNVEERRVLIVAHSDRGENIRIISARKATLRERKHYEEEN